MGRPYLGAPVAIWFWPCTHAAQPPSKVCALSPDSIIVSAARALEFSAGQLQ